MQPLIERYRSRLPVTAATPVVSLGEGSTPLLHAPRLSERFGIELWLKCEGANPTGSFKDRGMTVAVSKALEEGVAGLVCASTGNTAASAAAYGARAGLRTVITHAPGAFARGKLSQVLAVGAELREIQGGFDQAYAESVRLAAEEGYASVNSGGSRYRLDGQKTAAFEIVEELGGPPDALLLPYGGGGNTTAYLLGFAEAGAGLPRFFPVESADRPATAASAIRIVSPVHRAEVERARARTGGRVVTVPDAEILAAWQLLAREEGLFCEPSSAAGIAGIAAAGLEPGSRAVCIVTGHGLKDPDAVASL
jgi:threonine synthase